MGTSRRARPWASPSTTTARACWTPPRRSSPRRSSSSRACTPSTTSACATCSTSRSTSTSPTTSSSPGRSSDMKERGHSLESIKASIESRKPDFDAYIDPQKKDADVIIEVLSTQLLPGETEGNVLRVRLIQQEGNKLFDPAYLFDEGSTVSWIPCGRKLTCSLPGIKFFYGPDTYYGEEVSVLEMDGLRQAGGAHLRGEPP